ncbi:hypothetical protein Csa_004670 [Cucumis sativus]|uniref:Uncharacterized protein n=1 Tax=Cucumis sativus TaxID=3659 RepID=A0A0A0KJ89_CUCSA|nr:hypothetical protein Csa_004670 [Cucumis sativus]
MTVTLSVCPKCTLQQTHACLASWLASATCLEPRGWHGCLSVVCRATSHALLYRCLSCLTFLKAKAPAVCLATDLVYSKFIDQVFWQSTIRRWSFFLLWLLANEEDTLFISFTSTDG